MNIHDLRQAQADFTKRIDDILEGRKSFYKKRDAFTRHFSSKKIALLGIDEYVIGKGEHTFCRKIERDLDGLGRIIGATAFKFGVYFGKTESDPNFIYRNTKIWGDNPFEAHGNITQAILKLIEDGRKEDIQAIVKSKISPMFKGKILSTYYPERYLNVFSNDHLKYFLKSFDLDTRNSLNADPVVKREILLDFKNNDPVMRNWSADMFMIFLYEYYPKRPTEKQTVEIDLLEGYYNPDFPENPVASEIALNILPFIAPSPRATNSNNNSKPDYEKINRLNKKLGDRGEKIVKDFEVKRLENLNKHDLAELVDRVSLKSDNLGFDILSFEEDGAERYIEVKATRSTVGDANFFLTINELKTAQEKENYYIYLVYEILSKEPKIWIINNPFNPENKNVNLEPINFKVSIKASI